MPQTIVFGSLGYVGHNLVEMLAVGVGYKNLSESARRAHYIHNAAYASGIELVKYIIKQQKRLHTEGLTQKFVLSETQSRGECLRLSLRCSAAERHTVAREYNIVAVRPR